MKMFHVKQQPFLITEESMSIMTLNVTPKGGFFWVFQRDAGEMGKGDRNTG